MAQDAAWHEERRTYIGASDAPVLLGLSPYRSAYDLWREKTGQEGPRPDTPIQRYGKRVEAAIAAEYTDETGRRLEQYHRVVRHRRYPELAANPDRRVVGEKGLVQIKTSWSAWAEVPEHVLVQVQHEMGCTGAEWDDVALGTGFAGLRRYTVDRDDAMIENLFTIERAWWQRHIVEGLEPQRTGRHVRALRGEAVMTAASAQQADAARAYVELGQVIKRLEAQRGNVKEWLQRSLAGARKLVDPGYGLTITWTPWEKDAEETDWQLVAASYRRLLELTFGDTGLSEADALEELGFPVTADVLEVLPALESLHTVTTTKSGEAWRVAFKDVPQEEEEAA